MARKFFIIIFFICIFAFGASAAEVKEAAVENVKTWYVEDKTLPVVAIKIAFKNAGYAYDKPAGLAYAAAGMMNEGAGKRNSKAFQKALEENAIEYSADIDADNFYITVKTLSRNLDLTLELLNDSLTQLHVEKDDFERVRGQIITSLEKRAENGNLVASEKFFETVFAGHPYANLKEGEISTVKNLQPVNISQFIGNNFTKNNIVIAIAGDVDEGGAKLITARIIKNLPEENKFTKLPDFAKFPNAKTLNVHIANPQTIIMFGNEGVPRRDKDFMAAFLLDHIIGGDGFQARLMREVREKNGLAYSISTNLSDMDKAAVFYGVAGTESAKAAESMAIIKRELAKAAAGGVSAKELDDAKKFIIGSFPLKLDSNSNLVDFVLMMQLKNLGRDYLEKRRELIEAVTLEDANRVAKRLFKPGKLVFVTAGR